MTICRIGKDDHRYEKDMTVVIREASFLSVFYGVTVLGEDVIWVEISPYQWQEGRMSWQWVHGMWKSEQVKRKNEVLLNIHHGKVAIKLLCSLKGLTNFTDIFDLYYAWGISNHFYRTLLVATSALSSRLVQWQIKYRLKEN